MPIVTILLTGLLAFLGCGPAGPKTFPVNGAIDLTGADVQVLVGSTVETALESDETIRAAGEIKADGSFQLVTRHEGHRFNGAREGKHEVRIILAEDDRETHRRAVKAVAARFLDFKTSGLKIDVPTNGAVTLTVGPR